MAFMLYTIKGTDEEGCARPGRLGVEALDRYTVRLRLGVIVNRTVFLVDGFNVYHSLRESESVVGRPLDQLDVVGLCHLPAHDPR